MVKKRLARLILLIVALSFGGVRAESSLPLKIDNPSSSLSRCSRGELMAFRWIHVGYAALYLPGCQTIDMFSASPKRLRFLYERSIPAKAFREAAEEYLKINLGDKFDAWRDAFATFNRHYRDIEQGDYYDLVFDPKSGLSLFLNDDRLATLEDPEQGLAYFSIWFGKEPFSSALKDALLTPEM
ncbi:MAG: hypothetical protein Kow0065_17650 [Methylomicrobium sp.]